MLLVVKEAKLKVPWPVRLYRVGCFLALPKTEFYSFKYLGGLVIEARNQGSRVGGG